MSTLDFVANLKLNIEGNTATVDQMIANLEKLKDLPGSGKGSLEGMDLTAAKKAAELHDRMKKEQSIINDPKSTDQEKAAAIKNQTRLMEEYYKLINSVISAEIVGLAKQLSNKDEILKKHEEINKEYEKENQNLDKAIDKMDELTSKTGEYNDSVDNLGKMGLLDDPMDTMDPKEIERKRKGLEDTPENKDKRDALEAHLKVVNGLKDQGITTEEELFEANKKVRQEAQQQAETVDKTRKKKQELVDKTIEQAKAEGHINEQTAETLKDTSKILDNEEKITKQKKQRKSIKESKKATKDLDVPEDKEKPKKDSLLQRVTSATLYFAALRALRKMITNVISTVRELDKSITEVAMVTNMNRQQT
jgi:hypothetical protein